MLNCPAIARWVFACCALGWIAACSDNEREVSITDTTKQKVRSVRLVDPQTWHSESDFFSADSGKQFRIEVTTNTTVDTVPSVLVLALPVVSPDSLYVSGVALEAHDIARGVFTYFPENRSLDLIAQPGPGFVPYSGPSLSPSGEYLAYLANDRNYHFWLVIISWPMREVLVETPQVETRCTEFWGNALRWVSADSLELYMNLCHEDSWARAGGSVGTRLFGIDTVGIEVLEALRPQQP